MLSSFWMDNSQRNKFEETEHIADRVSRLYHRRVHSTTNMATVNV